MIPFVDGDPVDCDVAIRNWPGHPDCDIAEAKIWDGVEWTTIYKRFVSPAFVSAVVNTSNQLVLTFDGDVTSIDPNVGVSVRLPFRRPNQWNTLYDSNSDLIVPNEVQGYTVSLGIGVVSGQTITFPITGVFSGDTVLVSYNGIDGLWRGTSNNPRDKIVGFTDIQANNQITVGWDPNILFAGGVWGDSFDLEDTQYLRKGTLVSNNWVDNGPVSLDGDRIIFIKSRNDYFVLTAANNYNGTKTNAYAPKWSNTNGVLHAFGVSMKMSLSGPKLRSNTLPYSHIASVRNITGNLQVPFFWPSPAFGFFVGSEAQANFANGSSVSSSSGGNIFMKIRKGQGEGLLNTNNAGVAYSFGDDISQINIVGVRFSGDPNGWSTSLSVEEPVPDVFIEVPSGNPVNKVQFGYKYQNTASNSIKEGNMNLLTFGTQQAQYDVGQGGWYYPLPNDNIICSTKRSIIIGAELGMSDMVRCFDWCNV